MTPDPSERIVVLLEQDRRSVHRHLFLLWSSSRSRIFEGLDLFTFAADQFKDLEEVLSFAIDVLEDEGINALIFWG